MNLVTNFDSESCIAIMQYVNTYLNMDKILFNYSYVSNNLIGLYGVSALNLEAFIVIG